MVIHSMDTYEHKLMTVKFLYRGFNLHTLKQSALTPKFPDGDMEQGAECGDDRVQCGDSDFSFGLNIGNAIHSHEYMQSGENTAYLSFTPWFERAKYYALGGGKYNEGTVIKVSVETLSSMGFEIFSVNEVVSNPACIEDDEYSVYVGNRDFPDDAIIEETIVKYCS